MFERTQRYVRVFLSYVGAGEGASESGRQLRLRRIVGLLTHSGLWGGRVPEAF